MCCGYSCRFKVVRAGFSPRWLKSCTVPPLSFLRFTSACFEQSTRSRWGVSPRTRGSRAFLFPLLLGAPPAVHFTIKLWPVLAQHHDTAPACMLPPASGRPGDPQFPVLAGPGDLVTDSFLAPGPNPRRWLASREAQSQKCNNKKRSNISVVIHDVTILTVFIFLIQFMFLAEKSYKMN